MKTVLDRGLPMKYTVSQFSSNKRCVMRQLPDKNDRMFRVPRYPTTKCDGTGIQHVRRLGPYITHIITFGMIGATVWEL